MKHKSTGFFPPSLILTHASHAARREMCLKSLEMLQHAIFKVLESAQASKLASGGKIFVVLCSVVAKSDDASLVKSEGALDR